MVYAFDDDCAPSFWTMTVQRSDSIDEEEVRRALGLLVDPEHHVQVQALPSGRWRQVPGRNLDHLVATIREFSGEKGTYLSLNPFRGPLAKALTSKDILRRRWLLIDPDAVKAEKSKDASTTDGEKEAARLVTESVRAYLRSLDWPDPVFVDSGNNWQLLYRVELPNDKVSQQLLSKAIKALASRFDTPEVKLDPAVHDAKRICKIPGTMVRKGAENTPSRPWRMARLVSVPVALAPVPVELLKALAGLHDERGRQEAAEAPPLDPWQMFVGTSDATARLKYARSALEREVGIVATATQPGRNETLYSAALKLGTLVGAGLLDRGDVERQLEAAGRACGLGQDGDPEEIRRAIRNGFAFGVANPRHVPDRGQGAGGVFTTNAAAGASGEPLVIRASTITPKPVRWLWEGRIPKGFITVFAGRTGLGKSFVTCDIAARVTTGDEWPDSDGECVEPGNVLLISEDSFDYVLAPRLIAMEADLDRVYFLSWAAMARYQLADTTMLDAAFRQAGNPLLVAIDPPTNFLGGKDEHKNAEVRQILMNLVAWLDGRDAACVLITHVNKQTGKGTEALSRVIGSVAWTTTSRVAHAFVADAESPGQALFIPMKSNVSALAKGLSYRIVKTDTFARIEWLGQVDTTADEAMGGEKPATRESKEEKITRAVAWLRERFAEQATWPSSGLISLGERAGFNRDHLFEAKKRVGARARKNRERDGEWFWTLDADATVKNAADTSTVRHFEGAGGANGEEETLPF
jgi:putative DNA primase/helicase